MKFSFKSMTMGAVALAVMTAGAAVAAQDAPKGMAVAYPFAFVKGTDTARSYVYDVASGIAQKAGYAAIPHQVAENAWDELRLRDPKPGDMPTTDELHKFGKKVRAKIVLYGTVAWRTRSIVVGAGPKTISTATVNVYVYSVRADKVIFSSKKDIWARSDEKENNYKLAADILLVPVISMVSGGPETPQDQRAVQIALARAYHPWVKP